MSAADTANMIAEWALGIAVLSALFALAAAGFAGWQAYTAHRTLRADNMGSIVEWAAAEWIAVNAMEFRSIGPDDARDVWVQLTIGGKPYVQTVPLVRTGEALRINITGDQVLWDWLERQRPRRGEGTKPTSAFAYGALIVWSNQYGRRYTQHLTGDITRTVRLYTEPYPDPASGR